MFEKFIKYIKFKKLINSEEKSAAKNKNSNSVNCNISKNIDDNLNNIKNIFGNTADIKYRDFKINDIIGSRALLCYIDAMEDKAQINEYITKALMINKSTLEDKYPNPCDDLITEIKERVTSALDVTVGTSMDEIVMAVLNGFSILFINGYDKVLVIGSVSYQTRSISEPNTEVQVRGPREGFIEEIRFNSSLLRRKIKNPNLVFESLRLGKQTKTEVRIVYIKGIADNNIIREVRRRLNNINTDSILDSGYVEQFIEDHPFSPFPTIGNSERPDKVAAKLLEGRVAILCDGSPFVLTVPYLFIENIQMGEDYYSRPMHLSIMRLLRVLSLNITIIVPALYIAVTSFHPEMLPTTLLITTASSREGVPFPAVVESIIMITMFLVLRESALRLPRPIGQTLSIVGVLVIGETAARAGIIGPSMVIIGSLTGVTSFIVSPLLDSIVIYRLALIIASSIFGFYGVILVLITMLAHACSLSSFGVPYLSPIAPTIWKDLKDTFVRFPLWLMTSRPKSISKDNSTRQDLSGLDYIDKDSRGEDS